MLGKEASKEVVLLLPTLAPLKIDAMSAHLADLPKPITCVAFDSRVNLVFGYWALSHEINDSFAERYVEFVRRGSIELARTWRVEDVNTPIELVLKSGPVPLSWQDYWTLREHYVTPYLTWLEERPAKSFGPHAVACSIRVEATAGMWITAKEHKHTVGKGLRFRFWR